MKQMKQVHNIIINEAMKLIDRNEFVDQLVKKHPQLKKVEADLLKEDQTLHKHAAI
jgi:hypothetical protein